MMIKERGPDRRHERGQPGARRFARRDQRRRHRASVLRWITRIMVIVIGLELLALWLWSHLAPS